MKDKITVILSFIVILLIMSIDGCTCIMNGYDYNVFKDICTYPNNF